ncbi:MULTISPECIES: hypothetical protein [unclassified Burkholderia]|uniref:hypothetical protein n=1 Tax=unclassified Burkholderia TaxID=2613784 RepID=UPI000AA03C6F|nr:MULTISPECIES: hypothetical protein [unclassified Burkholderia]
MSSLASKKPLMRQRGAAKAPGRAEAALHFGNRPRAAERICAPASRFAARISFFARNASIKILNSTVYRKLIVSLSFCKKQSIKSSNTIHSMK